MADNVPITAGAGTVIATDEIPVTLEHVQLFKQAYSADGVRTLVQADADGVLVNLGANNDVTVTSLPAGLATTALQTTGNTSVGSIDTKTPALGQALAAASVPVVLTAAQITTLTPPAAIAGFALEAGHLAAIDTATARIPAQGQALAAASTPVVLTAAQMTTLTPPAAITGFALEATLGSVKTAVELIDNAISGAGFNTTQFGGTNVSTGTGASGAGIPRVTVSNDSNVLVTPPTLTKATQGATGFSVQNLKDAGRVSVMITASVASTATAETLITLTRSIGLAATGTGSSLAITTGKRFHIQALAASARNSTGTTASNVTLNFRAAVGGATTASSPLQMHWVVALPASAVSTLFSPLMIPDGFEIDSNAGTNTFGMTITHPQWVTGSVVATFDLTLVGYEY